MKKIEQFLNSGLYIAFIFLITFIAWTFYKDTPPHLFNIYNQVGLTLLVLIITFSLICYKNTMYTIPAMIGILFIVNKSDMDLSTATTFSFIYIAFILFMTGPIIHIIRFRPKFKKGIFFLGFLLIAISYVIPNVYLPWDPSNIPTSFIAFLYLGVYVFLVSTTKGNLNYLFKIMLFANLTLTAEVFFYLYQGYLIHPDLTFFHRIFMGWGRNLGWANINDMCFYISLTFPSFIYFIFKKPTTYLVWFLMILPVIAVILSKSRGGIIGFFVVIFLTVLLFALKGNKKHLTHGIVFILFTALVFYLGREVLYLWWDALKETFSTDIDEFSSMRLTIYRHGLEVFKEYPLFGGGWASLQKEFPGSRLFMYHSTLVQALATMGLFGLLSLGVHYFQIFKFMLKEITFEKYLFLIGYLASQAHGLVDNVQYAVPYSVLIIFILVMFETSVKKTSFHMIENKYYINET